MKKKLKKLPVPKTGAYWLARIQFLIGKHSTKPRTRGKYKGHSSTDALAWTYALAREIQADIRRTNRGIGYDENMALAAMLGSALFVWYAQVHRAKAYSPMRPLKLRRKALARRGQIVGSLIAALNDDKMMVETFDQVFNIPWGPGAVDGTFV